MESNINQEESQQNEFTNQDIPAKPQETHRGAAKKPAKPEKQSGGGGSKVLVIILALLVAGLLGAVGYMYNIMSNNKVEIAKKTEALSADSLKIVQQTSQLDDLDAKLKELQVQADELQLDKDSLQLLVQDIEKLKADLKSAKNNAAYYQAQINKIKASVSGQDAQIQQLMQEKAMALATIDTLQTEKRVMKDTITKFSQERVVLKEKVAIASIMKAEDISITAISTKGKEFPGIVLKNKQVDKLKINLSLAENKVAPQNTKVIMVRLIEPDGTVLFGGTEGGSSFKTNSGEEKSYTLTQNVSFSGEKQKVGFIYQKGNEYKVGKHTFEFYADGHFIGTSSFMILK